MANGTGSTGTALNASTMTVLFKSSDAGGSDGDPCEAFWVCNPSTNSINAGISVNICDHLGQTDDTATALLWLVPGLAVVIPCRNAGERITLVRAISASGTPSIFHSPLCKARRSV